jgi:hypothetical protein
VVSGVNQSVIDRMSPGLIKVTSLGDGRFSLELPITAVPEQIVAELARTGGRVVSLNPVRETLEDFFVQQVRATDEREYTKGRAAS